jgi:hypothetical protein
LARIIQGIDNADLVVADVTNLNPNVMYELGVAHALGKPTVMITQTLIGLPFDIRSYPAHLYSTYFKRASELRDRLQEIGEQHRAGLIEFGNPVSDFRRHKVTIASSVSLTSVLSSGTQTGEADEAIKLTLDEATAEFQQIFDLLTAETSLLTEHITKAVTEIARAEESKVGAERIPLVRNALAAYLSAYANAIRVQQGQLHITWRRFGNAMLESTQALQLSRKHSSYAAVTRLETAVNTAFDGLLRFRFSIGGLGMTAADMREACEEAQVSVDGVINELTLGKTYILRVKDLIAKSSPT